MQHTRTARLQGARECCAHGREGHQVLHPQSAGEKNIRQPAPAGPVHVIKTAKTTRPLLQRMLFALVTALLSASATSADPLGADAPRALQATAPPSAFSHPLLIPGLSAWFQPASTANSTTCVSSWQSLGDAAIVGSGGGCPSFSSPLLNGYAPLRLTSAMSMNFGEPPGPRYTSWTLFFVTRIWGRWGRGLQGCVDNIVMGFYYGERLRSCDNYYLNGG